MWIEQTNTSADRPAVMKRAHLPRLVSTRPSELRDGVSLSLPQTRHVSTGSVLAVVERQSGVGTERRDPPAVVKLLLLETGTDPYTEDVFRLGVKSDQEGTATVGSTRTLTTMFKSLEPSGGGSRTNADTTPLSSNIASPISPASQVEQEVNQNVELHSRQGLRTRKTHAAEEDPTFYHTGILTPPKGPEAYQVVSPMSKNPADNLHSDVSTTSNIDKFKDRMTRRVVVDSGLLKGPRFSESHTGKASGGTGDGLEAPPQPASEQHMKKRSSQEIDSKLQQLLIRLNRLQDKLRKSLTTKQTHGLEQTDTAQKAFLQFDAPAKHHSFILDQEKGASGPVNAAARQVQFSKTGKDFRQRWTPLRKARTTVRPAVAVKHVQLKLPRTRKRSINPNQLSGSSRGNYQNKDIYTSGSQGPRVFVQKDASSLLPTSQPTILLTSDTQGIINTQARFPKELMVVPQLTAFAFPGDTPSPGTSPLATLGNPEDTSYSTISPGAQHKDDLNNRRLLRPLENGLSLLREQQPALTLSQQSFLQFLQTGVPVNPSDAIRLYYNDRQVSLRPIHIPMLYIFASSICGDSDRGHCVEALSKALLWQLLQPFKTNSTTHYTDPTVDEHLDGKARYQDRPTGNQQRNLEIDELLKESLFHLSHLQDFSPAANKNEGAPAGVLKGDLPSAWKTEKTGAIDNFIRNAVQLWAGTSDSGLHVSQKRNTAPEFSNRHSKPLPGESFKTPLPKSDDQADSAWITQIFADDGRNRVPAVSFSEMLAQNNHTPQTSDRWEQGSSRNSFEDVYIIFKDLGRLMDSKILNLDKRVENSFRDIAPERPAQSSGVSATETIADERGKTALGQPDMHTFKQETFALSFKRDDASLPHVHSGKPTVLSRQKRSADITKHWIIRPSRKLRHKRRKLLTTIPESATLTNGRQVGNTKAAKYLDRAIQENKTEYLSTFDQPQNKELSRKRLQRSSKLGQQDNPFTFDETGTIDSEIIPNVFNQNQDVIRSSNYRHLHNYEDGTAPSVTDDEGTRVDPSRTLHSTKSSGKLRSRLVSGLSGNPFDQATDTSYKARKAATDPAPNNYRTEAGQTSRSDEQDSHSLDLVNHKHTREPSEGRQGYWSEGQRRGVKDSSGSEGTRQREQTKQGLSENRGRFRRSGSRRRRLTDAIACTQEAIQLLQAERHAALRSESVS